MMLPIIRPTTTNLDPVLISELKPFKNLASKMSRLVPHGLLSIAVITSVLSLAPKVLAQLFPGSRGQDVVLLQQALNREGFLIQVDGVYGPATTSAVTQFQQTCGLRVDGIAGPETNGALASGDCSFLPVLPPTSDLPVGPYVVVIPGTSSNNLQTARQVVSSARIDDSRRGSFINAGGYQERSSAQDVAERLKDRSLPARVEYRPL
ncbi:MAG TPA: peptidoglycan-binding domain-containing protein [Trichocoleus sp.]|jgi:hypothetical protein